MQLYLVRHAHALDAAEDATRLLSLKGEQQIENLAAFLKKSGAFMPAEIWHSPFVRALDTAGRLAQALQLNADLVETRDLQPEADPDAIASRLTDAPDALALVGHEPHLGLLASLLLTGRPSPVIVTFDKASVLALEGIAHRWSVQWHISPPLLG